MITDMHTHAFPDALAERAMTTLLAETTDVKAWLDGRLSSLLGSMDRAGIERSVVCSIATKPSQFEPILAWSKSIRSERIIPFPSVHPRDPDALDHVAQIAAEGFRGVKLHPYYQDFYLDGDILWPIYRRIAAEGLMLTSHTGFDVAFERVRRCDPARIARVIEEVPELTFISTHMGSWMDWDNVRKHLVGKPLYMEISYSLECMPRDQALDILTSHPAEYLLLGSDSPWQDQSIALGRLRALGLEPTREKAMLEDNAARLLPATLCGR